MEPLDLDGYIRDKLKEAAHSLPNENHERRDRIWKAVSHQLEIRPAPWLRVAAMIVFLLIPSGILILQNMQQKKQIAGLRKKIALLDKESSYPESPLARKQKEKTIIIHDTIRIIQPAVITTKTDTVEVMRYITDTVVVFRKPEFVLQDRDSVFVPGSKNSGASDWDQPSPVISEYILAATPKDTKNSSYRSRSISIVFGSGDSRNTDSQMRGIKAKF